jgi:hypothetical protein
MGMQRSLYSYEMLEIMFDVMTGILSDYMGFIDENSYLDLNWRINARP